MGLKANICQVCGGALKNCGTYYKCECCDTEYRIDESMSKEAMDAYFRKLNAFEDAERNLSVSPPRFDEAESDFDYIVQKYPDWSAGYWGLVRAKFGIKFEQDSGGKAVPSCYKSTYEDFRETDEYKKAIALAETNELRQSYEKMAEYIARVAKEWREEAQKYDYDVFISFKASNDLDGSETRDAREMHKLYDLLKDEGYRVFFSPVTLITDGVGGKGSEPYIFNALDKAKALIVYGSKKEYFSSTWVQNEWQRYLRAIKSGKKEKDSLLVLYEGFNPKELPQGLRRIQGIEYGISAYPAVSSVLERIFRKKKESERDTEKEFRRAEEEKRKAEEENAKKLQDVMAQFAAMQEELMHLKSMSSSVVQSAPITNNGTFEETEKNRNLQQEVILSPSAAGLVKEPLPTPAPAEKTKVFDPYYGQIKNDFQIVAGVLEKYRGTQSEVIVPENVKSIGNRAFTFCKGLTKITIPNSVTSISESAFSYCRELTSITIPESVTNIEKSAFSSCSGLTSITISNSVTSIGARAFGSCSGLTSITIPNSVTNIEKSAFSGCSGLTSITVDENNKRYYSTGNCIIKRAERELILGCKSSVIPSDGSVTSIGESAFSGCSGLTSITIPNSVRSIGQSAFSGCHGLTSITIPESVKSIGESAFSGCSGLTSITVDENNKRYYSTGNCIIKRAERKLIVGCKSSIIPADGSVTSIVKGAFSGCSGLTSITIPESVKSIGESAFMFCKGLTSITIPNGVTSIVKGAFMLCKGLTSINIPNSVTYIGDYAFSECSGLTSITIPNGVTSIGESAFSGCSGLTSVTIPNSVTYIGDYAFRKCSGLTSVTIPNSVTKIGGFAFSDCTSLKQIIIPQSVMEIGFDAFKGCENLVIYAEASSRPSGWVVYDEIDFLYDDIECEDDIEDKNEFDILHPSWYGDCPVVWGYGSDGYDQKK